MRGSGKKKAGQSEKQRRRDEGMTVISVGAMRALNMSERDCCLSSLYLAPLFVFLPSWLASERCDC